MEMDFGILDWYGAEIKAGLDVYTAGFPISGAGIGYTLTKGIVSKPQGSVNWPVASVDNIIEHTARINPGNSGGPLVTGEAGSGRKFRIQLEPGSELCRRPG